MRPKVLRLVCFFLCLVLVLFVTIRFEVRMVPEIDAPLVVVFDRRLESGLSFQLDLTGDRYVYSQAFIENNDALRNKTMLGPEMVRGEGSMNIPHHVILENIAWTETWNCDVLLSQIGINRRLTSNGCC